MPRATYAETRRKLVIAFDVGTTYSGVSYSILDPGQVPEIKGVARFPAQKHVAASSKIPTIIYYDPQGATRAIGAEAVKDGVLERATDGDWIKYEWFKLHLQPKSPSRAQTVANIPPLPNGKTVVQVFADYYRYLFDCTCTYIRDTHTNGDTLLAALGPRIDFVLSHPNGWDGFQQSQMREAAVLAGLIPDTPEDHSRISFVSEGEASLHFAISNGFPSTKMKDDEGLLIVDAGGGTIDISAYARQSQSYVEIAAPECHLTGSVFVTVEARNFLSRFLLGSEFIDDLESISKCFDQTTKHTFGDVEETQFIKFGSFRDNDEEFNIRFGQLKLTWHEVASFFDSSIASIVGSVKEQGDSASQKLHHIVLVGGFASSDYLYSQLRALLEPEGFHVTRPENHVSKAVADGAISFYLNHFVKSRIAKVTYGTFALSRYEPDDPEHVKRQNKTCIGSYGERRLEVFSIILPKDAQVSQTEEFRAGYYISKSKLGPISFGLWSYNGSLSRPRWRDIDTQMYSQVCIITADLSHLADVQEIKRGLRGRHYRLDYEVALLFGLTEFKAQLVWKEKGVEKRSDARIIYDLDATKED